MQAYIRQKDRAILAVAERLHPVEGADIVDLDRHQAAHWGALSIPPGEIMALGDDGTIGVLVYAPTEGEEA